MTGTKNLIIEKRGTKIKAKILEEPKPKLPIFIGTKNIFKPNIKVCWLTIPRSKEQSETSLNTQLEFVQQIKW